jgi:hypothetical protein
VSRPGLTWAGLTWAGLTWAGLTWAGLTWAGLTRTPDMGRPDVECVVDGRSISRRPADARQLPLRAG